MKSYYKSCRSSHFVRFLQTKIPTLTIILNRSINLKIVARIVTYSMLATIQKFETCRYLNQEQTLNLRTLCFGTNPLISGDWKKLNFADIKNRPDAVRNTTASVSPLQTVHDIPKEKTRVAFRQNLWQKERKRKRQIHHSKSSKLVNQNFANE